MENTPYAPKANARKWPNLPRDSFEAMAMHGLKGISQVRNNPIEQLSHPYRTRMLGASLRQDVKSDCI